VVGDHFLLGLRGALTRDDRDSFMRPTKGSLLDISYEQCFGDFTFPLVNVEYSRYFTLFQRPDGSGRQVLALHSQVAWAGSNTPVYERYFAGGFRSMRGFEFRGVGVWQNGYNVGGDFMFLNSAEYQIPVLASDNFYMVAFVDSGTVESSVEIKDYRVSAGFGVRFVVPMLGPVPIALDFGFPILKADGDKTQVFSFWLGFFK
jgi:outer membrane protein assembly factor BamA